MTMGRQWDASETGRVSSRARTARWRASHPEYRPATPVDDRRAKGRQATARWRETHYAEHILSSKLSRHKRRAAVKGGDLTAPQWRAIVEYFDNRCAYCLQRRELHMDHVVPISRGGPHTATNVVPACRRCNATKNARGPLAMMNKGA